MSRAGRRFPLDGRVRMMTQRMLRGRVLLRVFPHPLRFLLSSRVSFAFHLCVIIATTRQLTLFASMPTAALFLPITYSQKIPAKMRLRNKKHAENVTKRGNVVLSSGKENTGSTVGPVLLGLFLFVVVGNGAYLVLFCMC